MTDESDLDLGILLPPVESKAIQFDRLLEAQIELEKLVKRNVDLINMRGVSSVLQFEILNTSKRIYTKDPLDVELYELLTIALFQKLAEERKEIVEEGLTSGFYKL